MSVKPTKIRYVQDRTGTGRLMNSPEMLAMLMGRARRGRAYAESIAPRGRPPSSQPYARSFIVEGHTHAGPKHDRAEARLVNTSDHAVYVEHGGRNTEAHHVLARTVDVIEQGLA